MAPPMPHRGNHGQPAVAYRHRCSLLFQLRHQLLTRRIIRHRRPNYIETRVALQQSRGLQSLLISVDHRALCRTDSSWRNASLTRITMQSTIQKSHKPMDMQSYCNIYTLRQFHLFEPNLLTPHIISRDYKLLPQKAPQCRRISGPSPMSPRPMHHPKPTQARRPNQSLGTRKPGLTS